MKMFALSKRAVAADDIVGQSKVLCRDYVYWRLERDALLPFCAVRPADHSPLSDVSSELQRVGAELEATYADTYTDVVGQLHVSLAKSDKSLKRSLMTVAGSLFKSGAVTWAKIVSLFAIAGGLAVDCVRQKHPQYVASIIDVVGLITAKHLYSWTARRGGWLGCLHAFQVRQDPRQVKLLAGTSALVALMVSFFTTLHNL